MRTMASRTTILTLILMLCGLLAACKQEAPSPWKEMPLPLRHGEILPGASANALRVIYRGTDQQKELYREFRRALERSGYAFEREGKDHDPAGKTYASIFHKDGVQLLLSVSGDPDVTVEITRID